MSLTYPRYGQARRNRARRLPGKLMRAGGALETKTTILASADMAAVPADRFGLSKDKREERDPDVVRKRCLRHSVKQDMCRRFYWVYMPFARTSFGKHGRHTNLGFNLMNSTGWPSGPPPPSHFATVPVTEIGWMEFTHSRGVGTPGG